MATQAIRKGQILNVGGEMCTTYPQSKEGMKALINDYYNDQMRIGKSAGFTGYGTNGVFNAIMGKEITIGMFASNNMLTAVGARPYDHEGMRIAYSLAKKGGIGTRREGHIPDSVKTPIKQVRQPYKELPYSFNYGLALKALEGKDDTSAYQEYVDIMTATYSDALDYDLLRPLTTPQPTDGDEEICLTGISRAIASSTEVGQTYGGVEITGDMVSPYGGVASDLYSVRTADKQNNFDGYVNNAEGVLSLEDMNELYAGCAPYWADQANPNNKIFGMSIVAEEKLGQLVNNQNMWLESVFVQRDFNGVKTLPGREIGGILASAYRNIPIIVDGNYNYDMEIDRIGTGMGEIQLLDLDNQFLRVLTPVEFRSTEDYAITRELQEFSVMQSRMEYGIKRFLGSGRIVNKTKQ